MLVLNGRLTVTIPLSIDYNDYSSPRRYNVTLPQTVVTDQDTPSPFVVFPTSIDILDDNMLEDNEYFQVRIVGTSDLNRVRIGQRDTANVTILDDESTGKSCIGLAILLISGLLINKFAMMIKCRVMCCHNYMNAIANNEVTEVGQYKKEYA